MSENGNTITVDGKQYLAAKDAAIALGANEHYVRQLTRKFEIETMAKVGGMDITPSGLPSILHTVGTTQRRLIPVEAIEAYKSQQSTGGRVSVDGKKAWKVRLSPELKAALEAGTLTDAQQKEIAESLTSGSNYNREKSRAYRQKRAAAAAASDDDDDVDDGDDDDDGEE